MKQNGDEKIVITEITCSILNFPSTSDYCNVNTGDYKSTHVVPTIKHLTKEKILDRRSAQKLVMRGHNIRLKISAMEKSSLKSMVGR